MRFVKMHGAGNDYVYVDCFDQPPPTSPAQLAQRMAHRRFGVGSDGLILIHPSSIADARMQMFNADGSEAEMCGNGIRCVAKYLYEHRGVRKSPMEIETGRGVLRLELLVENQKVHRVRVDMGEPVLDADRIPSRFFDSPVVEQPLDVSGQTVPVTCLSMGNPHCVVFVNELTDHWVLNVGPKLETHRMFPARTNVEFVQVLGPGEVRQRTWERGSGETWACGTGASAVCVAGVLTGRTSRRIINHLLGGDLELEWNEQDNHVYMTGPAEEVFVGEWPDEL
ncbi:MAG: diaminopimelate epimerase [Pirellulaceae bacterium]|nr:MAG: diaminopimelate epimerase [Pirellulaceae bacterium]